MSSRKRFIYMTALRMKKGELEGLFYLREDVADCIIPMLIVPPAKDRGSSSQDSLFAASKSVSAKAVDLSRPRLCNSQPASYGR